MKHAMLRNATAPVVFVQYLMAIAIVEGIQSYDQGYQDLPVKLKWPNDICKRRVVCLSEASANSKQTRKIPPSQERKNMSKSAEFS
jgi:biotin-(acetyl-CoA carboxylase) ligase